MKTVIRALLLQCFKASPVKKEEQAKVIADKEYLLRRLNNARLEQLSQGWAVPIAPKEEGIPVIEWGSRDKSDVTSTPPLDVAIAFATEGNVLNH